jgi:uncharacterized membrane protein
MYLPSINELNKNALSQKVVDENDDRVRRTVMKQGGGSGGGSALGGASPGVMGYSPSVGSGGTYKLPQTRFSVNPQDN